MNSNTPPLSGPGPKGFGICLALLLAAVFPGVVAGTSSFFLRDYGVLGYPFIHYAHESFWRGELPLWNPLSNCGAPFLAQWGTMVLYPFSLFYLILPLPWSLGVFCLAHLWLGGMGMYALAGRWTGNRWGAALAGIAFVFNGVTLSCLSWPNYTVALGWMPWLVLCMEKAWREGGRKILLAIAVATFQVLVGVPELVVLTWVVIGALACVEIGSRAVSPGVVAKRIFWVVAATSGLAAAQVLPFMELAAHSQRGLNFGTAKWAMPSWGWASFLAPRFHTYLDVQSQVFQTGQEFLSSYYLGAGMVVLAVAATWTKRQARVWVLAGLTLWALIMALGDRGYLYTVLRKGLPVLGLARYPIKFVILAAFTVPLLAAFLMASVEGTSPLWKKPVWKAVTVTGLLAVAGMACIVWSGARHPLPYEWWPALWRNTLARGVCLVLFLGALGGWASARSAGARWLSLAVMVAVLLADIFTHTSWQNPVLASSALAPGLTRLDKPPRWGGSRVLISREAEASLLYSRVPGLLADFLGKRLALWSNLNVIEGVPKVNGSSTLQIGEQAEVQKLFYDTNATELPRLADFLTVSHQTASNTVVEWAARTNPMALISIGQAPEFLDRANTLAALKRPEFDPRRTVYLPLEAQASVGNVKAATARVESARYGTQRVEADVATDAPTLLVVAQSHYPAWKAYVDDQETTLWRANHAFQALRVPAGRHRVALAYDDRTFRLGAWISGLSLAACAYAALRSRKTG